MRILKTLQEKCDIALACLIVVDVQNDFCSPEGAAAKGGNNVTAAKEMVPRLLHLIEEARKVDLPIVYIQTTHSEWTDSPSWLYRRPDGRKPETCRQGSWGAEFYDGISPQPHERIVIKHRYSAFINTDLNTVLKARGVESVLVTGVATNVCVETTARDAFMYDYYVTMVDDCAAAYDSQMHEATLQNIRKHFGTVASSQEIISTWQRLQRKKVVAL
ncbi:MAG: cysteine hydrolase [Deltaproteobacteria bacterium]|nr:cysteine hydrolase [Deltaproteobacteria bacterium]